RCYRSEAVSGHINLGHDLNESVRSVLHKFTNLILRVEAAVIPGLIWCGRREGAEGTGLLHAPGSDLGQLWQRFYFDAPALVVGEVEVKNVEFVSRHVVDEVLHFIYGEEVAGDIEHESAPAEAWMIFDRHCGHGPFDIAFRICHDFFRQKLIERLDAVEDSGGLAGTERDSGRSHVEAIACGRIGN